MLNMLNIDGRYQPRRGQDSLSPWERVGVRAERLNMALRVMPIVRFTLALSLREREPTDASHQDRWRWFHITNCCIATTPAAAFVASRPRQATRSAAKPSTVSS